MKSHDKGNDKKPAPTTSQTPSTAKEEPKEPVSFRFGLVTN